MYALSIKMAHQSSEILLYVSYWVILTTTKPVLRIKLPLGGTSRATRRPELGFLSINKACICFLRCKSSTAVYIHEKKKMSCCTLRGLICFLVLVVASNMHSRNNRFLVSKRNLDRFFFFFLLSNANQTKQRQKCEHIIIQSIPQGFLCFLQL